MSRPLARAAVITASAIVAVLAAGAQADAQARVSMHTAAPVITPVEHFSTSSSVSPVLFLNRCVGGCVVHKGDTNDAVNAISSIPTGTGDFTLSAFAMSDDDWTQIVQCVQDVYSPFNVTVTDVLPTDGTSYDEAMIAGLPMELGEPSDVLGIAPLAQDCSAQANAISFTFANGTAAENFVDSVCWTAAQESAHVYGLDHEYQYTDGTSACNDPMTYRTECGNGEKFFRNVEAQCGEYATRACHCTQTQNSAFQLTNVFGAGTPTTAAPTTMLTFPANGAMAGDGEAVHSSATAPRGIDTMTLLLNGYPWLVDRGSNFDAVGVPVMDYAFVFPTNVPDGVIDIQVSAADDLGATTLSSVSTVEKGTPCSDASTCLTGQLCGSGKCYWVTPTAEIGDACAYPQFCESGHCDGDPMVCSQPCTISGSGSDACPASYSCQGAGSAATCQPAGGGCCSAGDRGVGSAAGELGLATIALVCALRRRRFWLS